MSSTATLESTKDQLAQPTAEAKERAKSLSGNRFRLVGWPDDG